MGKIQQIREWHEQNVEKAFTTVGNLKDSVISKIHSGLTTIREDAIGSGSVIKEVGKLRTNLKKIRPEMKEGVLSSTKQFVSGHPIEAVKSAWDGLLSTKKAIISPLPIGLAIAATPAIGIVKGAKAVGKTIAVPGKLALQGIGVVTNGVKKYFNDTTPKMPSIDSSEPVSSAGPATPDLPPRAAEKHDEPAPQEQIPHKTAEPEQANVKQAA